MAEESNTLDLTTEEVNEVVFVNGELPEFMRNFIEQKIEDEKASAED